MRRVLKLVGILALGVGLVVYPFVVPQPQFWVLNVGVKAIWLGTTALSLTFLQKFTGLLSLGQLAFYGMAGYAIAYLTSENGWSYAASIPLAIAFGTLLGLLVALFAVRSSGVYFLMLTLAVSQLMFFAALQAYPVTGGHSGITGVQPPTIAGLDLATPLGLYWFALLVAALLYALCRYLSRTPFGLAMEGVRDSEERMRALGYNVYALKVAAFTVAAFVASTSGVVALFYHRQITPDGVGLISSIDVLVAAVLGGAASLPGAYLGAAALTFVQNFAQFFTPRHLTLTGAVFVIVVMFFPGGIAGLGRQFKGYALRYRSHRARHRAAVAPPAPDGGQREVKALRSEGGSSHE
ncbi:branched-chain amino acid ABC transporter permease [Egibacter rhizosphaerae]|uniref:Branched-chain amino acid ABC transporter permease n=1 Tax=Egibacter rhizosphaerae TaxID=1670831 RepID=A0A411YJQ8_9ACTN|nr:branched-chain amino acid ABC transporter permease [Egibacter rhizosphaerae]QBI21429.1 branched-chain amino acid ABC transporter permease [Egibacter rhizosphaerae]